MNLELLGSEPGEVLRPEKDPIIRYRIEIEAPDFEMPRTYQIFALYPQNDSPPIYFHLKATKAGKLPIIINAYQVDVDEIVAQTTLRLTAYIQSVPNVPT